MASQGVLDQIRDLQSFIDDFAAEAGTSSIPGTPTSIEKEDEKTQVEPPIVHQKPNEKEEDEQPLPQQEKTLVEQQQQYKQEPKSSSSTKIETEPLSILSYDLNLSDDFSSLVDQFKDLKVSPVEIKKLQQQNVFKDLIEKMEEEKVQLDPVIISVTDKKPPSFTTTRSRRTSVSSKRSQKSSKSSKSARRLQNEKKQFKQHQSTAGTSTSPAPQPQKYIQRSFDEMMRIPDIYERLAFYEKTLDLCLKAESPFASWCKSNQQKGKPEPLLEGYVPPARLLSPETPHHNDFGSMSSTFSGSISMFLKKATISTPSVSKRHLPMDNNGYGTPYIQNNSSSIFGRSISRLNLSRSTQIPRYDHPIASPSTQRFHPKNKVYSKKPGMQKQQQALGLSPLSINYSSSSSTYTATPRSTSSTPTSFGSTSTINSRGESTTINSELAYMMNVLPQIDMRILQNALNEAKGDPMVAISIAVSTSKQRSNESPTIPGVKSTKFRTSKKRYGNRA
ncbi:hypothetical protein HMPREF1544_10213 [Mucor circinelloides 1006PhL]|uniref:CUE domain-containing protein n=1 Tax=Mucor circinelloides f. circinelloides (strain 1006PhL) TaxID=1220926 RepID=S2JTB6_MUCC1|nr:hypothetical protein HMPREF1544_10213 [Mucor circinelloides 1006PhL]